MKRDIRDSLLLAIFSFLLAIAVESIFRSGNTWVASMLLLFGRNWFASVLILLFLLGYLSIDYVVLHHLREPLQRRGASAGGIIIQAFALMVLMPH